MARKRKHTVEGQDVRWVAAGRTHYLAAAAHDTSLWQDLHTRKKSFGAVACRCLSSYKQSSKKITHWLWKLLLATRRLRCALNSCSWLSLGGMPLPRRGTRWP